MSKEYFFTEIFIILLINILVCRFWFIPNNLREYDKENKKGNKLDINRSEYEKFLKRDIFLWSLISAIITRINIICGIIIYVIYVFFKISPLKKI